MSNKFHKDLVGSDIHVAHAFTFADATARNAASVVAADVGKIAKQSDDNTYYILKDTTPTWSQIDSAGVGAATKEVFFPVEKSEASQATGDYRAELISQNGEIRMTFNIPQDFTSITSLVAVMVVNAGAQGAGKDIDLFSDYASNGEDAQFNSESDTTSTFTLGTNANEIVEMDISGVFSAVAAGDYCGILISHAGIGGSVNHIGLKLRYT